MVNVETLRLRLRPLCEADRSDVIRAMNDLSVAEWLAPVPYPYGDADFDQFLRAIARPGETFALEDGTGFAGVVDCGSRLGFWLLPAAQGKGYATEAAEALLARRFSADGRDVTAGYFEGNLRSARVLDKLGFVQVGRRDLECRPLGRLRPHVDLRLSAIDYGARAKPFA